MRNSKNTSLVALGVLAATVLIAVAPDVLGLKAPNLDPTNQGGGTEALIPENESSEAEARVPGLIWPVGRANHDDVFLQLGPDSDPATGSWFDYECSPQFTYDGHRGTDIMAYNFRLMDQGVPILAAADGTVSWTQTGYFDRNYWTPYIGLPNGINIRHSDGSDSQYFHLRQHSVAVEVGDYVEAGQIIGYMGSSGSSPNPHLHFELWQGGVSQNPNNGACSPTPSLWLEPFDYPGHTDLTILDWDLFLDTDLTGVEGNNFIGDKRLKNRAFRPLSVSREAIQIGVWVQLQGLVGTAYTIRVLDNEGNEFARSAKGVAFSRSVQWHALYFDFSSVQAMESPDGEWTLELVRDSQPVESKTFEVATASTFSVRFFPLAGRSFKHLGAEIRDTLRVINASGGVNFSLVDAPTGVTIEGNEVVIRSTTGFLNRNGHFKVSASDQSGRADTMYYHVVTPSLPLQGVATSVTDIELPHDLRLEQNYPNPFSSRTTILVDLSRGAHLHLRVFDVTGKTVVEQDLGWRSPGEQSFNLEGGNLPSGTYFYEVRSLVGVVKGQMTVVR